MSTPAESTPIQVSFPSVVIPQGEGTFLIKPGKPLLGRARLTVAEAAAKAMVSPDTILRLYDAGFLEGGRPTPRKTFIFADSLDAHLQRTVDREYWEQRENSQESRRAQYRRTQCGACRGRQQKERLKCNS